jgi:Flp pilus assembly protein TadG
MEIPGYWSHIMKLRRDRRGQSVIEFTFMAPWLLFLFVGVFDLGFFS